MSKAKKATYEHITPQLVKNVEAVLEAANRHSYSVSLVYGTYNAVMQKNDTPQTCASCLSNRAKELKNWYADYQKVQGGAPAPGAPVVDYNTVVAKYALAIGDTAEMELATLTTIVEDDSNALGLTDDERVLVKARYDELSTPAIQYTDAAAPGYVGPGEGVLRFAHGDGLPIDFTSGDGLPIDLTGATLDHKGTVKYADGTNVKPGKYPVGEGTELAVQVGGKATLRYEDLT